MSKYIKFQMTTCQEITNKTRIVIEVPIVNKEMDNHSELMKSKLSKLYPLVDDGITPLPKCWNPKDKHRHISLCNQNTMVHYQGLGKSHRDAACVRTVSPIPSICGVYYFEIQILCKDAHGFIGLGLATDDAKLNKLPGYEMQSYGYHGGCGRKFHGSQNGLQYGPTFKSGDIVGCGLNFVDCTCFYTKNGNYLGAAFYKLKGTLYPIVGFQSKGAYIVTNFGQNDFVFKLSQLTDDFKTNITNQIHTHPIKDPFKTYKIIQSYLLHHGFLETALAFAKNTGQSIDVDLESIKNRVSVLNLIKEGDIDGSIHLAEKLYPKMLANRKDLLFKLLCGKLVVLLNRNADGINQEIETREQHSIDNCCTNEQNLIEENQSIVKQLLTLGKSVYNFDIQSIDPKYQDVCNITKHAALCLVAYRSPNDFKSNRELYGIIDTETLTNDMNSAILQYLNLPLNSSIDLAPNLTRDLLKLVAEDTNPLAAFVNVENILKCNTPISGVLEK